MKIILENKNSTFEIRKLQNLIEKCSDKFNFMKHSKYIFWDSWAKLVSDFRAGGSALECRFSLGFPQIPIHSGRG